VSSELAPAASAAASTADHAAGWETVVGQPAATSALRSALRSDELAHAWMVVGPRGVGQQPLAAALAASLNCPDAAADAGCGTCDTCVRTASGAHTGLQVFLPEGATYTVEHVRDEWTRSATRSATEGRRKVLRITAADRMNEAAQNAFLKILEEPPPSVVWLLEVEDESALLETIVSRCRRLSVVPWGPDALLLEATRLGVPEEQRAALVRAAMGSPERLADLADPDVAEARWRHLGVLDRLATAGPAVVVPLAKELVSWAKGRSAARRTANEAELAALERQFGVDARGKGWPPRLQAQLKRRHARLEREEQRRALDLLLDDLASYLRDLLTISGGGGTDALVNVDHEAALRRDAARVPPTAAIEGLRAIAACREALDRNGAAELQLERVLLALALPVYAAAA
jgi:DNA polymerase-3 subunit delta'